VSRAEARARLDSSAELDYYALDEIFGAFGFVSDSPSFETQVYYHPSFRCGAFTARDDGLHVVTHGQRSLVREMLRCVEINERART